MINRTEKENTVNDLEKVISAMDFDYFGTGQHKIDVGTFLSNDDAVLLDVRSMEEKETLSVELFHHCRVLHIPVNEVPSRLHEIPQDKLIGVFCSSGVRNVIIFAYLTSRGYKRVKVLPGGYAGLTEGLMPGKIHKRVRGNS